MFQSVVARAAAESQGPVPDAPSAEVLQAAVDVWGELGWQHAIGVTGQSMWPTIRHGDRVWLAFGVASVDAGDVIVYRAGEKLLVHRVVKIWGSPGRRRLIAQGDHSIRQDPPLDESQIVGRVVSVERRGRNRRLARGYRGRWIGWMARLWARVWLR